MLLARLKAKREAKARACPVSKMDWPEVLDSFEEQMTERGIAQVQEEESEPELMVADSTLRLLR